MSAEDKQLRLGMHPAVCKCTKAKSITLFKHVLDQLDYWDKGVIELMTSGIPFVGLQSAPNGYLKHLCPASVTEEELSNSAIWRRRASRDTLMRRSKRESLRALIPRTRCQSCWERKSGRSILASCCFKELLAKSESSTMLKEAGSMTVILRLSSCNFRILTMSRLC